MERATSEVTIYVRLLDEGTDVWRPVQALALEGGVYSLLAPPDYDRACETWEFDPGSYVTVEPRIRDGNEYLVVTGKVEPSPSLAFQAIEKLRQRNGPMSIEEILSARDEGRR